jgi:hypothetical protein
LERGVLVSRIFWRRGKRKIAAMLQYESKVMIRCLLALLRRLGASKNLKVAYTKVRVHVSKSLGAVNIRWTTLKLVRFWPAESV